MNTYSSISDWKADQSTIFSGSTLGFVPTMGALHEGHLSLVKRSISENDLTMVSIFLNPTQFNNTEDLEEYPRNPENDKELLINIGNDILITPGYSEIYPDEYRYKVQESTFSSQLCGSHRPGHFDGVLTVVLKLLNIAGANRAYFGEKDYQQYLLIRNMASAFFLPTEIIPCPTIREADGLAAGSRNQRLTAEDRAKAPLLYQLLKSSASAELARNALTEAGFDIDYVEDIDNRRFAAVYLGRIRLIDNIKIETTGG